MKRWAVVLALACDLAQAQARPQMENAEAARHTATDYLAGWSPAPVDATVWRPELVVAQDGSGTHRTLQAALDALPTRARSSRRHYILIKPGTYRETVCASGKAPFTVYGSAADAAAVVIVQSHYNALAKRPGIDPANPCQPSLELDSFGTPGSASMGVFSDDVQLAHLTVANDAMDGVRDGVGYPPGAGESGGAQAVALMLQGDRLQLENVRLLGHQDTFFVKRATAQAPARVHVHASLIAGDVDFIFGNATLVLDDCTVLSRAGRRTPGNGGHVLAPSTPAGMAHGFLVINSRLVGEAGLAAGSASLGRAWDEGVARGAWAAGVSPNGQALVRGSTLGAHIGPWAASTSRRPFSASGPQANRMAEYGNTPPQGADISREILAANDGWAAAEGGTRGGADALPADVFEVRSRAELAAAFTPGSRPRIVKVRGRIDLGTDAAGKPLGEQHFRDPAFDFEAYLKAYDPDTWGRKPLEGPLEEARLRSAKAQAAHTVLRVPSNTTLVGMGSDAAIVGGMLFLDKVDNVIIRNLHFSDAYDHFPAWDPKDNGHGEWNSEYDNVSLRGATHVWIDHCTFDDGARPDQAERIALGRRMQHHDGLLDITQQSNHVTVSWNHFRQHDKTTLIGSSDGQQLDAGKLKVTLHHNLWEQVMERTPRVRYGQVHVYNNLFAGRGDVPYAFGYSLGVGLQSRIFSERNAWETSPEVRPGQLTRLLKGTAFFDRGSLLNGQLVDLLGALRAANPAVEISGDVGWQPVLSGPVDPAGEVAAKVRAGAGAGRF